MLRSEVNRIINNALICFNTNGWILPPAPKWDITDFGLNSFNAYGLVLVNLCEEPEYCEKIMYAVCNQVTPTHCHKLKKEDIICRFGSLALQLWNEKPNDMATSSSFLINKNCTPIKIQSGDIIVLNAGERITIPPGIYHQFYPLSDECIIGEVSTNNDDINDNFFVNPNVGRFPDIEEDTSVKVMGHL